MQLVRGVLQRGLRLIPHRGRSLHCLLPRPETLFCRLDLRQRTVGRRTTDAGCEGHLFDPKTVNIFAISAIVPVHCDSSLSEGGQRLPQGSRPTLLVVFLCISATSFLRARTSASRGSPPPPPPRAADPQAPPTDRACRVASCGSPERHSPPEPRGAAS